MTAPPLRGMFSTPVMSKRNPSPANAVRAKPMTGGYTSSGTGMTVPGPPYSHPSGGNWHGAHAARTHPGAGAQRRDARPRAHPPARDRDGRPEPQRGRPGEPRPAHGRARDGG